MGIAALNPSYKIPESVLVVIGGAKVRVKVPETFIFQLGTDLRGMRPGQPPPARLHEDRCRVVGKDQP